MGTVHKCALLDLVLGQMSPIHTISFISLRPILYYPPLCVHTSQSADVWTVSYWIFILLRVEFWILIPKYEVQQNIVCSVHLCSIIEEVNCPFEYAQWKVAKMCLSAVRHLSK